MNDIVQIILTAVVTGLVSSIGTVAALRVHVTYLREAIKRHDEELKDVNKRVNELNGRAQHL